MSRDCAAFPCEDGTFTTAAAAAACWLLPAACWLLLLYCYCHCHKKGNYAINSN